MGMSSQLANSDHGLIVFFKPIPPEKWTHTRVSPGLAIDLTTCGFDTDREFRFSRTFDEDGPSPVRDARESSGKRGPLRGLLP